MGIPLAVVERVMRNAGAERIQAGAVDTLRESAQSISREVASDAVELIKDEGRNKVTKEDVDRALEL